MNIDVKELAKEIAVHLDPLALLDSDYVAGLFKCSPRYLTEVISKQEGFPRPASLTPSGHARYRRLDIENFIDEMREPPIKRGRGKPRKVL